MINHIMKLVSKHNKELYAEYVPNDVNRMMYVTYKFAGFKEVAEKDGTIILKNNLSDIQEYPDYVQVSLCHKW